MSVRLRSYNEILGDMVRKIIADTPLNDLNTGSVILTLLEAAAANDFENNIATLNILELLNVDSLKNNDLDAYASQFGLERTVAVRSSGFVTITDSTITPRKTALYPVRPAPIEGDNIIYVVDASEWDNSGGTLYIGRGTQNFEGPINYTSIDDFGSFYAINLASSLEKDHLISDEVIDAQGTQDRKVLAGTSINTPANNIRPAVEYRTLRDAVIPAGENTIANVSIQAVNTGSVGNAGIDTISNFQSIPFPGARVSNSNALTNGRDVEADEDFRERIKAYANSLARGTQSAILSAVIGISDQEESKQVESAVIVEPTDISEPSLLYIDDGSGFQPSTDGQSVDQLLKNAVGDEEFLQLANFPLPRPQVVNLREGPYSLEQTATSFKELRVDVDGFEDVIQFADTDFNNPASATPTEVVVAINNKSTLIEARLAENSQRILIYTKDYRAEKIRVVSDFDNNANDVLKFPTNEFSFISLYQNNRRLRAREEAATLVTLPFPSWQITQPGNLVISIDGTPAQDRSFDTNDFGGQTFNSLTLNDWAEAFNNKYAGLTAQASNAGTLIIKSNKEGTESQLRVLGGTYFSRLFNGQTTEDVGQDSDFDINRQNGNVRVKGDIAQDDTIQAGSEDTKGTVTSTAILDGEFNVGTDAVGRDSVLVIVPDASRVVPRSVVLPVQETISLIDQGNSVMRVLAPTTTAFREIQPGDYIYLVNRGDNDGSGNGLWFDEASSGIFKVIGKGGHLDPKIDTYVDVINDNMVIGTPADTGIFGEYLIKDSNDIQAFFSDAYPQVWNGNSTPNPAAASITDIVNSINDTVVNVRASIFKTNQVKITSRTEEGGSIAIPVISGNAGRLFEQVAGDQEGEFSHIANLRPQKDFLTYFRRTEPQADNVFLDRYVYTDVKGAIDANAAPGDPDVDPYAEELVDAGVLNINNVSYDNYLFIADGNNKDILRAIKQILPGDRIGTRHAQPRTLMDYIAGDRYNIAKTIELSDQDNLVVIFDDDAIAKTVDIRFARLGQINSGSTGATFVPDAISFSADDADNEDGIDFGNNQVWGTSLNDTNFNDYAVWFQARNWYATGGAGSGGAELIIRNNEYGPIGENSRFRFEYPAFPDNQPSVIHQNTADGTLVSYFFGSGSEKLTNLQSGNVIDISDQGNGVFRYTFPASVDLSTVQIGDVMSINPDTGLSEANSGAFRISDVNDAAKYVDIYNPNGVVPQVGTPETYQITFPDDVPPAPAITEIEVTEDGSAIDQKYIVLFTSANIGYAFFFSTDPGASVPPVIPGITNFIEIEADVADTAAALNTALNAAIDATSQFNSTIAGSVITVTNVDTGVVNLPTVAPTLSAAVTQTDAGTNEDNYYNQKYFVVQDSNGPVAVFFDSDDSGSPEPSNPGIRSIKINTIATGDVGTDIAAAVSAILTLDAEFTATVAGNVVTLANAQNGPRSAPDVGTMPVGFGLTVSVTGVADVIETIQIPTSMFFFNLIGNDTATVKQLVNDDGIMNIVEVTAGDINLATRDEVYAPAGPGDFSQSLSFGHDPNPANNNNTSVGMYDGETWVLNFQNTNPNFVIKRPLLLTGVVPAIYQMDTTTNVDDTTGEYFKLIPRTIENVLHHLRQKALSQLQIISEVDFSADIKRPQFKSLLLGSEGAIEIVGGRANAQSFSIIGDSQAEFKLDGSPLLEMKIPAFPQTFSVGQHVKLENPAGVPRLSRLGVTDTMDVVKIDDENYEYRYNPKNTDFNRAVKFTITDVSASYGRTPGSMWRWTHSNSGSFIKITDRSIGVIANTPLTLVADGSGASGTFVITDLNLGAVDASGAIEFTIDVSSLAQADHFVFENADGITYAIWIDIDGANVPPTSGQFVNATNKIKVGVTTGAEDNDVVGAISTALITLGTFSNVWTLNQTLGANLAGVVAGDMLMANGTLTGWEHTNKSERSGENEWSGWPIIAVSEQGRYMDIVNPYGVAMAETLVGLGSKIEVMPSPAIRWRLGHYARPRIVQAVVISGQGTLTLDAPHRMNVGDTFDLLFNTAIPDGGGVGTVLTAPDANTITYTVDAGIPNGVYTGGLIKDTTRTVTKYRIENLGYNNLFRLQYVSGDNPEFLKNGVAIDDLMTIQGQSFFANNSGNFRVLGVEDDNLIFENQSGIEQLDDLRPFNDLGDTVQWTNSSAVLEGSVGDFVNVKAGDWVKKAEDADTLYRQVVSFNTGDPATATEVILGGTYQGSTSAATGIAFDQVNGVGAGVDLLNNSDIIILEGDSVRTRDSLFISETADDNWFNVNNTGTFAIVGVGTNFNDDRPFLRVQSVVGVEELARQFSVPNSQFVITENDDHAFSSIRVIEHIQIDEFNPQRRQVFVSPADRRQKFTQTNETNITALGKLGFNTDIAQGVDGYTYYTGLLRTVQRIVDGFEPNANLFPGRKAVGAAIETLPPLIQRIKVSIDVTTKEGVNITEITNEIKSAVIQYVNSLGVAQDVILSDIIVRVKNIEGVEAVTFIDPVPSEERIPIADNEKAFVTAVDISIA